MTCIAPSFNEIMTNPLPGPFPWVPFLGNALDLFRYKLNTAEYFKEIQLKYGDFYEIHLGFQRILVISNSDVAYPIHSSSVAHNQKFLYRDIPNSGWKDLEMEDCGIVANRNLEGWKINREFFIKMAMSKKFLKMITEKTYEKATDMFKLWDIMISDKRDVDLSKWLEKFAGDIAVSTSTGLSTYSMISYFNLLGYEYNLDDIPISEREQSSKLISLINSFFTSAQWVTLIPSFIRRAPGISYFNNKALSSTKQLKDFLAELIQRRRAEINLLSNYALLPSDFLTLLLTANTPRDLEHTSYKSLNRPLNDHEIFGVIRDIFLGSFET
ncbi:21088_t:CDS:2, partial [Racocetra persica]